MASSTPPATHFASPARVEPAELEPLAARIAGDPVCQALLEGYPGPAAILDRHRQVVACNRIMLDLLGLSDLRALIGKRPGEALSCIHAREMPAGCGTAQACSTCGAVRAILTCQGTRQQARGECLLTTRSAGGETSWELQVLVTPLTIEGVPLTVFAALDIGDRKRREAMERFFFHDALSLAGSIEGLACLVGEARGPEQSELIRRIMEMTRQLVEQIRSHRDLLLAEQGELKVRFRPVPVAEILDEIIGAYRYHPLARGKTLRGLEVAPPDLTVDTEPSLLHRVLGNLIKNALEACPAGEAVTVGARPCGEQRVCFSVHNPGVIPPDSQLQIFKRSFSTKGQSGRGLGTFSVKLLTTRFLKGTVGFVSDAEQGTRFQITLPASAARPYSPVPPVRMAGLSPERPALRDKRVLLVDDSPDNCLFISHCLEKAGVNVVTAGGGEEALHRLAEAQAHLRRFDLVLMDLDMPGIDGIETTRRLRQAGYDGPVVALTAHTLSRAREMCAGAGFTDFAVKPIQRQALLELVAAHVSPAESDLDRLVNTA